MAFRPSAFSLRRLESHLRRIADALEEGNQIARAELQLRLGGSGGMLESAPQRRRGLGALWSRLNSRARAGVPEGKENPAELIETTDADYARFERLEGEWLEKKGRLPNPEEDIEEDL